MTAPETNDPTDTIALCREVLARDAQATPGPWTTDAAPRAPGLVNATIDSRLRQVAEATGSAAQYDLRAEPEIVQRANAGLIALYRTAAPVLAREVVRMDRHLNRFDCNWCGRCVAADEDHRCATCGSDCDVYEDGALAGGPTFSAITKRDAARAEVVGLTAELALVQRNLKEALHYLDKGARPAYGALSVQGWYTVAGIEDEYDADDDSICGQRDAARTALAQLQEQLASIECDCLIPAALRQAVTP